MTKETFLALQNLLIQCNATVLRVNPGTKELFAEYNGLDIDFFIRTKNDKIDYVIYESNEKAKGWHKATKTEVQNLMIEIKNDHDRLLDKIIDSIKPYKP